MDFVILSNPMPLSQVARSCCQELLPSIPRSMLSSDLLTGSMQQIADAFESQ
jgi:hypothetical protein